MENKSLREKIAITFGIAVVLGAIWFWSLQVGDVIELLRMAAGE